MSIALAVTVQTEELVEGFIDSPEDFLAMLADLSVSWDDDAQMADWLTKFRTHAELYGSTERSCLYGLLTCLGVELLAIPRAQEG